MAIIYDKTDKNPDLKRDGYNILEFVVDNKDKFISFKASHFINLSDNEYELRLGPREPNGNLVKHEGKWYYERNANKSFNRRTVDDAFKVMIRLPKVDVEKLLRKAAERDMIVSKDDAPRR